MPNGKKKKGHKMATHKRKKRLRKEQAQEQVSISLKSGSPDCKGMPACLRQEMPACLVL